MHGTPDASLAVQAASLPADTLEPHALVELARQLNRDGRYLDAQPLIPRLEALGTVPALVMAARLLGHLGARRESEARMMRLWRSHRDDAEALVEMARATAYRRGAFRAWRLMQAKPLPAWAPAPIAADWHSLRGFVLGSLRDFEGARRAHGEALALAPGDSWIHVEWAYTCEQKDAYDEAVAAAERALSMAPRSRAATQVLAHLYTLVDRDADAIRLLEQALADGQSGAVALQLAELQLERGEHEACLQSLSLAERFHPLADKTLRPWIDARRTDAALALGRLQDAAAHARRAGGEFYEGIAARIDEGRWQAQRTVLPVGFVRQHALTCAPATLTALCRYWGREAAHLEIAEKICYDGTPYHSERQWSQEQGFVTREFTVDGPTARSLVDAGIPFTLSTVHTASGHLQAVVGYDLMRGTLLIRDPFKRTHNEFDAESLFSSHRSTGPRGMLLLPPGEAHRLAGIELPEAPVWDLYHGFMTALSAHRRDDAAEALAGLESGFAGHRLALWARRSMAAYDNDPNAELAVTEALLERYPDDNNLRLAKASLLAAVGSRAQQAAWWESFAAGVSGDPVALTRHADFLSDDGRELRAARKLYERVLSAVPGHAPAWSGLAYATWQRGKRSLACEIAYYAACLADMNEVFADTHFRMCRILGRASDGIEFLRARAERLGRLSSSPVITLFTQLDALERGHEAFEALERGLALRPQDGGLLLFAADMQLRYGRHDRAGELLERAQPHAYRPAWLRLRARWLRETRRSDEALACAHQAAELDPRDVGLNRLIAALVLQREGRAAALAYLRAACEKQPHHLELQQMFVGWLGTDEHHEAIAVLRRLVERNPAHVWAHRELAYRLSGRNDHEGAWAAASEALRLAPQQTHTHSTLGYVRLREGRLDEARRHLREALAISVDNDYALDTLVSLETTLEGRRGALQFVQGELERQVTLGDALLTYQECAQTVFDDDELQATLDGMLRTRDDLWQAWTAVAIQQMRRNEHEKAIELLGEAIGRFPLVPRLHVEQARALILCGRRDAARERLAQALQIAPGWQRPVRMFVETVMDEATGYERALPVLDAALHREPEDADLRALRARIRLRMGERELARSELEAALQADPSLRWGWDLLDEIHRQDGRPGETLALARRICEQQSGNVSAWMRLADHATDTDSALEAVNRGLALEPRHEAAFEAKLNILFRARRLDELEHALAAAPWPEGMPINMAAFKARLERARDNHLSAVRRMRELLASDPSRYWLWQELADWHDEKNENEAYREAAGHLVRLAPNHSAAHGYLAHASHKCGDLDTAGRHYARALEIDPAYLFVGLRLADIHTGRGEFDAARSVLQALRAHHDVSVLSLGELRAAVRQGDRAAACDRLADIVRRRDEAAGPCDDALALMKEAGWADAAMQVIEAAFSQGPCARSACRWWLARLEPGWLPGSHTRRLLRALAADPARSLMVSLLEQLAATPDPYILRSVLRRHRQDIARDMGAWGALGYLYISHGRYDKARAWLADWRSREDVPGWILDNHALACRDQRDDAQAREASLASLALDPRNTDAMAWLAIDAARAERLDEVRQLLQRMDDVGLRDFYAALVRIVRTYLAAATAGDSRLALEDYAQVRAAAARNGAAGRLVREMSRLLVQRHTPPAARPWRWLQFAMKWS